MYNGFYGVFDEFDASFGFLENIPVGEYYNLYDFLHGYCDEFAAALSDYYGYEIEYILDSSNSLVHVYCVAEIDSVKAYIDVRGITTDAKLFFDEFADSCSFQDGRLYDLKGECQVLSCKNTGEMYNDENRELNRDKDLVKFFKSNNSYYDMKDFKKEISMRDWLKNLDEIDRDCVYKYEYLLGRKLTGYDEYHEIDGLVNEMILDYDTRKDFFDVYPELKVYKNNDIKNEDKFEVSILSHLKEKGFDISQIELNVEQFIDDEHKNCLWYGGPVATVEYQGHVFWLEAHGDVRVTWFPQEGFDDDEYDYINKNNDGAYSNPDAVEHFVNDAHLKELENSGRLCFGDNNWFEIFVETPDGVKHDLMNVCSSDDLEECLFEMVESMDENIKYIDEVLDNKAKFLKDFFLAQHIPMSVAAVDGHIFAKDDEGNKWVDAEIYDFALNECLCFEADGSLSDGLGAAEPFVERLKEDAKSFGVEITAYVKSVDNLIADATGRAETGLPGITEKELDK